MVSRPVLRRGRAYKKPMTINVMPLDRVNHQAERPAVEAIWAVPTVAPPPMTVPAMLPATKGKLALRPPRL